MAENITHDRLNRRAETWLLANAYPLPAANASNSKSSLDAKNLPLILRVAELHGVLPAIVRAAERDFAAQGNDVAAACRAVLDNGRLKVAYYTGQGLLLTHHAGRVMTAFRAANLRAAVVKGAIAARRLVFGQRGADNPGGRLDRCKGWQNHFDPQQVPLGERPW